MRIYQNKDGSLYTTAVSEENGADTRGHVYLLTAGAQTQELRFQLGPVKESGINGIQNEQVIAALVNRLQVLNTKFPCRENSLAITKLEEAMFWLEKRTADRERRGVEGHNQP
jgi:hypothetical protein